MKWNGIVSQLGQSSIAPRFARANRPHAASRSLGRKAIPHVTDGLDRSRPELLPQPADADVDDVRARVEVIPPDIGEQLLAADSLAAMADEMVEEPELTVGEVGRRPAGANAASREIELEWTDPQDPFLVLAGTRGAQMHAHTGKQLVERERLRQVVACAEFEAAELRAQVGACRQDQHREARRGAGELAQHGQAVEARQEQVEDDEVVAPFARAPEPGRTVGCLVDGEALRLEPPPYEREDPRLVLDDQDRHFRRGESTVGDRQMTGR